MKLSAKLSQIHSNKVLLEVNGWDVESRLSELEVGKDYHVQFTAIKSQRSIEQNKLLWKIIDDIAMVQGLSSDELYCQLLEMADIAHEYIVVSDEAVGFLKNSFRATQFVKKVDVNGKPGSMYKCFIGSSKFTIKEMNELIDTAIAYGYECGMDMSVYDK